MTYSRPSPPATGRSPWILVAGLLIAAASVAALRFAEPVSTSPATALPVPSPAPSVPSATAVSPSPSSATASPTAEVPGGGQGGEPGLPGAGNVPGARTTAPGAADGVLPGGATVFDGQYPGIARLDAALRAALQSASTDAAHEGVRIDIDSGWRSRTYQEQLFRQAVSRYGSTAKAARWVAPPGTSAHESGNAVDIGQANATAWLSEHGATYGLCQIYRNEPWHYELRPAAIDHGCPPMYASPAQDPRLQQ